MKRCSKCGEEKLMSFFHKDKNRKDGLKSWCKVCRSKCGADYYRVWYGKNRERKNEYCRQWKRDNVEYFQQYYIDNKEKYAQRTKEYQFSKRKSDVNFRIAHNLRSRLRLALRNGQKVGSAVQDLGCSVEELKEYLELKFKEGMTWENWSHKGWHIDHVTPLSSFDLTDRKQFLEACNYTNLQPLWVEENLRKGKQLWPTN